MILNQNIFQGKKKFIDKKKAVTFHLVHRSQHDPLFVDESAPQHVLVPQAGPSTIKSQNKQVSVRFFPLQQLLAMIIVCIYRMIHRRKR